MAKQITLPYSEAIKYIDEADVLLFRAPKSLMSVGRWMVKYTGGIHSHVGLAHWDGNRPYCVEQREFKGGRSVTLHSQVARLPNTIDVYRAEPYLFVPKVGEISKKLVEKDTESGYDISWERRILGDTRKAAITDTSLDLTGTPYGWGNIWEIFKGYAPGMRLVYSSKNGDDSISQAYVCSTVVTYSYRINYGDPCPNLSDKRTTPADIAQSSMFHYLFTIGEYDAN